MIQAALNGGRSRAFHLRVPYTPTELAADAAAAVRAGAACLHVHPRGPDSAESMEPGPTAAALEAIRAAVPGIPVGVSTGIWIAPGSTARIACLAAWPVKPDYVSVNLSEPDAPDAIAAALAAGIGVEAGLWSLADVERFLALGAYRRFLRILVEINEQDEAEALAVFAAVMDRLTEADAGIPVLAHGLDASLWPVNCAAVARGLDIRTGLEDGAKLPDGSVAVDNAALVAAALSLEQSRGS